MDSKKPNPIFTNKTDPNDQKSPAGIGKGIDRDQFEKAGCIGKMLLIILAVIGIGGAVVGILVYIAITQAIVISCMWEWFMVPLGVPGIGLLHALGISVFISYITSEATKEKIQKEYRESPSWWVLLLHPWIVLALGWWIHQYM